MILVSGATGRVGRELVAALRRARVPVRALVRDVSRGEVLGGDVDLAVADLDDHKSVVAALAGVDRLFIATPPDLAQQDREKAMIDAAHGAGVQRIVKLSVLGADPAASFYYGRSHGAIERHLQESGSRWTILRANGFFDNLLFSAEVLRTENQFRGCQGDGEVSLVDVRDVAAVASAVLVEEGYDGSVLQLTGPEALSAPEQAAILSESVGRTVAYRDLAPTMLRAQLITAGRPEWSAQALIELHTFYKAGGARDVSSGVCEVLRCEPRRFAVWCDDHRAAFGDRAE